MGRRLPVGIDSYSLISTGLDAFSVLEWTQSHGGEGVQFTGLSPQQIPGGKCDTGFLRELGEHAKSLSLYIEWGGAPHIPFDLVNGNPLDIRGQIITAAKEAQTLGTRILRSCSGGLMRWNPELPTTERFLSGMVETFKVLLPELEDMGVTLAMETHFEFTTWELLKVFDAVGAQPGGGLGICLDTMNLMTMLEHPVKAMDRVLPWVVATHAKDGCIIPATDGYQVFTTQVGQGVVPWDAIIGRIKTLAWDVTLSIEDHGGSFDVPYFDPMFLSRFPDLTTAELASLQKLAVKGQKMAERGLSVPVSRADWPDVCESRVARGIAALKAIVEDQK